VTETVSELGRARSLHRASFRRARRAAVGAFVLAIAALVASAIDRRPTLGVVIFSAVLGPALGALFVDARRRASVLVVIGEDGVRVDGPDGSATMRWSEVDALWMTHDRGAILGLPVDGALDLVDAGGRRLRIPAEIEEPAALRAAIDAAVTEPLVQEALDALRDGEPMYFGELRVDMTSIVLRDERIPWTEISAVRLVGDHFAFLREGSAFPRATLRYEDVPHAAVLARVLEACTRVVRANGPFARSDAQ